MCRMFGGQGLIGNYIGLDLVFKPWKVHIQRILAILGNCRNNTIPSLQTVPHAFRIVRDARSCAL